MGAAAAVALLALSAAPASGGFRYVPPAEAEAAAEPAAKGAGAEDVESPARVSPARVPSPGSGPAVLDRGVAGTSVSGASVLGTSVWRVHEGEMLRAVCLTDRRYRLDTNAAFEGGFADAVQALFRSLSHLPHAPVATRSEGGTALVVRHRARRVEEGEDRR